MGEGDYHHFVEGRSAFCEKERSLVFQEGGKRGVHEAASTRGKPRTGSFGCGWAKGETVLYFSWGGGGHRTAHGSSPDKKVNNPEDPWGNKPLGRLISLGAKFSLDGSSSPQKKKKKKKQPIKGKTHKPPTKKTKTNHKPERK